MTKIKKYILENLKEFTNLHTNDVNENNTSISDLQYEHNYNEVEAAAEMVSYQIYKGTNYRLACDIALCGCGELTVHIYDNNKYAEIMQFYLSF